VIGIIDEFARWVATSATGVFAGAALYISLVEHPARLECGGVIAVTQWAPSYRRATVMQASLALVGSIASIAAAFLGGGAPWLVAGILLLGVVPFTLLVIYPTNERLLDPALDKESPETLVLLTRWGRLHLVRTILSLASFFILAAV
jgi:hypothetical protein